MTAPSPYLIIYIDTGRLPQDSRLRLQPLVLVLLGRLVHALSEYHDEVGSVAVSARLCHLSHRHVGGLQELASLSDAARGDICRRGETRMLLDPTREGGTGDPEASRQVGEVYVAFADTAVYILLHLVNEVGSAVGGLCLSVGFVDNRYRAGILVAQHTALLEQ